MKAPLFSVTIRESWKSILIASLSILGFALMMMSIYPTMGDMLSDPQALGDGISLTQTGVDDDGNSMFNLTWELKPEATDHVAIGTSNPFAHEMLKGFIESGNTSDVGLTDLLIGDTMGNGSTMDDLGITVLYLGRLNYAQFTRMNNESFFFVVYLDEEKNYTPVLVSEQVVDLDLSTTAQWDEWLSSPFVEGMIGRTDFDITTPEGFMAVEFFSFWPMFLFIFIGIKAGGVVAPHVEDKSADILLATGYSRTRFLTEKLGVVGLNLVAVNLAGFLGILLGGIMVGETLDTSALAYTFLGSLPAALAIMGVGLVFSMIFDEGMKCTWAIMGIVMGMYVIGIVTNVVDAAWADVISYLTIFDYYDAVTLMIDKTISIPHLVIPLVVAVITIAAAYWLFQKKEIQA